MVERVARRLVDLGGKHPDLAGGELPEPSLGVPQPPDTGREIEVNLVEG